MTDDERNDHCIGQDYGTEGDLDERNKISLFGMLSLLGVRKIGYQGFGPTNLADAVITDDAAIKLQSAIALTWVIGCYQRLMSEGTRNSPGRCSQISHGWRDFRTESKGRFGVLGSLFHLQAG